MKMNKKGFLLGEETLKIIIAVICIIFLVYLLFSIYNIHLRNKELEKAKASLEHLIREINAGKEEVRIYNPLGWSFYSFPQYTMYNRYGGELPEYCSNRRWENCLCICAIDNKEENISKKCDNLGYCLENEFVIESKEGEPFKSIMIEEPPLTLSIDHENKTISKKIEIKTD